MLTADAVVRTDRSSRYLVQLCRHARQMGQHLRHRRSTHAGNHAPPEMQHVEWSDTHGTIRLNWGQCTIQATLDTLTLHAEAATEDDLKRIKELITGRLEKIGRRDHLTVTWHQPEAEATESADPTR